MIVVVTVPLDGARYEVECEVIAGQVEPLRAVEIRGQRGYEVLTGEVLDAAEFEDRAGAEVWRQLLEDAAEIAADNPWESDEEERGAA